MLLTVEALATWCHERSLERMSAECARTVRCICRRRNAQNADDGLDRRLCKEHVAATRHFSPSLEQVIHSTIMPAAFQERGQVSTRVVCLLYHRGRQVRIEQYDFEVELISRLSKHEIGIQYVEACPAQSAIAEVCAGVDRRDDLAVSGGREEQLSLQVRRAFDCPFPVACDSLQDHHIFAWHVQQDLFEDFGDAEDFGCWISLQKLSQFSRALYSVRMVLLTASLITTSLSASSSAASVGRPPPPRKSPASCWRSPRMVAGESCAVALLRSCRESRRLQDSRLCAQICARLQHVMILTSEVTSVHAR